MALEDEIEFFGFAPLYLLKNIEEELHNICKDDPDKLKRLDHNYKIFEEYILQSCFSFPDTFSLERKLTDHRLDTNLQNDINEYVKLIEEVKFLCYEKTRLTHENEEMLERMDELTKIKKQIETLNGETQRCMDVLKRVESLEKREEEMEKIAVNPNESTLTVLLDDEKFKREVEKKEKGDFLNVYDMANIDAVLNNIKK